MKGTARVIIKIKGGPGSGNWGHRGRPGKRGGSSLRSIGLSPTSGKDWLQRYEKKTGKKHPSAEKKPKPVVKPKPKPVGAIYDEIKVGDTIVIRSGYGRNRYANVKVIKVLKTQIVVESTVGLAARYNKLTGREVGGKDGSYDKDMIATLGSGVSSPKRLMNVEDLEDLEDILAMNARR